MTALQQELGPTLYARLAAAWRRRWAYRLMPSVQPYQTLPDSYVEQEDRRATA